MVATETVASWVTRLRILDSSDITVDSKSIGSSSLLLGAVFSVVMLVSVMSISGDVALLLLLPCGVL